MTDLCYSDENYLYKYNGDCFVPSLGFIDDTCAATRCGAQSVEMNALINTFIESKKLYFNTTKCFLIHLGPKKDECCTLKVHEENMKKVDSEKYLGDVLSNSGNNENIENRQKQGTKTISNLLSILKEIGYGSFYVKTGIIYRDAILKPKLLLNSEVWHGVTLQQVSELEEVDRTYLRTILRSHSKVAIECLHFETGTLPLKYELMKRRLMYLWKILHVEETELISRVYNSQLLSSHPGDWVRLVQQDKSALGLELPDEDIKKLSKNRYKKLVEKKIENYALVQLNQLKMKHSKSGYLTSSSFKTQNYFLDSRFNRKETQLLFKLRSRTLNVKMNFPNQHEDKLCKTCKLFPETQSHLLQCPEIVPKLKIVCSANTVVEETMLYGSTDNQLKIVKIYTEILEIRKSLLENTQD